MHPGVVIAKFSPLVSIQLLNRNERTKEEEFYFYARIVDIIVVLP